MSIRLTLLLARQLGGAVTLRAFNAQRHVVLPPDALSIEKSAHQLVMEPLLQHVSFIGMNMVGGAPINWGSVMHQYQLRRIVHAMVFSAVCMATAIPAVAQTPADNTKTNTRDRAEGEVTADQQKENPADRDITQKIRQSLVKDKSLSTYAHNVKVIARDGQVTLKGPVRSEDEKRAVAAKAAEVVGDAHVTNEISVAPPDDKKPKG